jgi:hypothetical protein
MLLSDETLHLIFHKRSAIVPRRGLVLELLNPYKNETLHPIFHKRSAIVPRRGLFQYYHCNLLSGLGVTLSSISRFR